MAKTTIKTTTNDDMAFPHDGKKFSKENQPESNGRPPKIVSKILAGLKEEGELVTASMVKDTYQVFMSLKKTQLTDIANDDEQPMMNRIIAKAILSKKGFEIIETMMDRANGKPLQSKDVTSGGEPIKGISRQEWVD